MADLAPQFAEAFRDHNVNGDPSSGAYKPEKQKIRALGSLIDDALTTKEDAAKKGQANGYASLDAGGKVPSAQLPAVGVMSVNGKEGPDVNLGKADIGLGDVANIAPADMPISNDMQQALDEKVDLTGAQTLTEKTLKTPVIEGYTEGHAAASGTAFAPALGDDTIFAFSTTGNATITLPAAVVGKSFTISVIYGGAHSITWAGTARRWPKGEVPVPTSVAGKIDVFSFLCVVAGTWLAFPSGENF